MLESFILPGTPVPVFWCFTGLAIIILGISKSGISGAAILALPLMMMVMPVDKVAATLLPLLILCDLNAIYHHRTNVDWPQVMRVFIPAVVGIVIGTMIWWKIGQAEVDDYTVGLKRFVGVIAIVFGLYILARESSMEWVSKHKAGPVWAVVAGVGAGITTTLAHAAGPIVSLYLFSQNMGRTLFVGTMAWTFTLLNITKLPFYGAVGLIETDVLLFDLVLVPLVPIGSYMGKWILNNISETVFNRVIMVLATLGGIQLLFNIQLVLIVLEWLG